LSNLDNDGAIQLALPFDGHEANTLDSALDNVRDRFGSTAITRATLLGHHERPTVPLLPD
jgi:DNA polymerase-4